MSCWAPNAMSHQILFLRIRLQLDGAPLSLRASLLTAQGTVFFLSEIPPSSSLEEKWAVLGNSQVGFPAAEEAEASPGACLTGTKCRLCRRLV